LRTAWPVAYHRADVSDEVVRIRLRSDDGGAYALTASGVPEELGRQLGRHQSADVLLGAADGGGADETLVYRPAALSSVGLEVLSRPSAVLMVFAYLAHDEQEMLDFDAGISEEYTAFYATRGVHYSGVFRADGLGGQRLGEIIAFDAASVEEAERMGNDDLPQRIVDIEDECRTLQDREASRFVLWLVPRPAAV
jgi:hypothetical protein